MTSEQETERRQAVRACLAQCIAVPEKIGADKTRLAQECAKLDPREEQALAEEGMSVAAARWLPY